MHTARLGLVVPKKGTAHAHRRNRVKRLVRQEFRMLRDDLPPVDIVIQVFGAVNDHGFVRQLRQQLTSIAGRLDKLEQD